MWHQGWTVLMGGMSHGALAGRDAADLHEVVLIRRAGDADMAQARELAQLDSAAPLEGDMLVAVVDGCLRAALELASGRVVADPFCRTAAAVGLLRLRACQLSGAGASRVRGSLRANRSVTHTTHMARG